MTTSSVNLDTTQYVRINIGQEALMIQAHRDSVRIVFNDSKPSLANVAFHMIDGGDPPLQISALDTNVWALAMTDRSSLVVTELPNIIGKARNEIVVTGVTGAGDLVADAWGVNKVSLPYSLFHSLFTNDVNQSLWLKFHEGVEVFSSTYITSEDAQLKLTTDATITETLVESREAPRYQPNRGHLFSCAVRCPDPTAACEREWGLGFDGENEVAFELKPDGKLYAVLMNNGVYVKEEEIDTSVLTGFDVTKNNIYDIQYQWRGAGNYKFYIGDPGTGLSKLVHTFDFLGKVEGATMQNPALPVHFSNTSLGGHAPLYVTCVDITAENGKEDRLVYASAYAEDVAVNGTNEPVMVVRQPPTIGANSNTNTMHLARITVTCDKKALFKVWLTRDPTSITGATFKSVNSGSYVECDSPEMDPTAVRATAVDTTKMNLITAIPVLAGTAREVDNPSDAITFPIVRGDYLVITVDSSTSVADALVEWGEAY